MTPNLFSRVRRNHALEHATIHVLSEKFKRFGAQGNATPHGFFLNIFGDIPPEEIARAAEEALARLRRGEHLLALHPNCGTVHLTMATVATLAAQGTYAFEMRRQGKARTDALTFLNILPTAILVVVLSLIAARPLGMYFQTFTTDGRPGTLAIREVRQLRPTPIAHFFRVLLGQNKQIESRSFFISTEG